MPTVFIRKSNRVNKKLVAILPDGTSRVDKYPDIFKNKPTGDYVPTVHFGDNRYEDYTQHEDELRKSRYISRHIKNENWRDPNTAGFWSRWLLWNKPTLEQSAKDIEKHFGIKVRFLNE